MRNSNSLGPSFRFLLEVQKIDTLHFSINCLSSLIKFFIGAMANYGYMDSKLLHASQWIFILSLLWVKTFLRAYIPKFFWWLIGRCTLREMRAEFNVLEKDDVNYDFLKFIKYALIMFIEDRPWIKQIIRYIDKKKRLFPDHIKHVNLI